MIQLQHHWTSCAKPGSFRQHVQAGKRRDDAALAAALSTNSNYQRKIHGGAPDGRKYIMQLI